MTFPVYLRQLAQRCTRISTEIADDSGFVAIKRLIGRFDAHLIVRPLLVEAILASTEAGSATPRERPPHKWCLLLDQETYSVKDEELKNERFGTPLPQRLRNTVAHELAHSLAFRATEFGVELPKRKLSVQSKRELVEVIERETEKLSPFLLLSNRALEAVFSESKPRVTIDELSTLTESMGVSRPVLVNRFRLLEMHDESRLLTRSSLRNMGVGIGRWVSSKEAVFKPWPIFSSFDGGKVPSFFFELQKGVEVSPKSIFDCPELSLLGGALQCIECSVDAGTPKHPKLLKLPIQISIEPQAPKSGAEFLFLVQLLPQPRR